jgi:hypothetical protein
LPVGYRRTDVIVQYLERLLRLDWEGEQQKSASKGVHNESYDRELIFLGIHCIHCWPLFPCRSASLCGLFASGAISALPALTWYKHFQTQS